MDEPTVAPAVDAWALLDALNARPPDRRFTGTRVAEFEAWQASFRPWLAGLFGGLDERPWQAEQVTAEDWHDCRRVELRLLAPDGDRAVPATVLEPAEPRDGAAVLCLHGHGQGGRRLVIGDPQFATEIGSSRYDYGLGLARAGYTVLVPELLGFGERAGRPPVPGRDPCDLLAHYLALFGRCLLAVHLADCRGALGVLAGWPGVDPARLGLCGLSFGGRMSMYTAALDDRVRAAVASGASNTYHDRVDRREGACGAQILPGLLPHADTPDIFASIAPRPLQVQRGDRDPLLPPGPVEDGLAHLARVYAAAGVPGRLSVDRFEGGHEFDLDPALEWFKRWL